MTRHHEALKKWLINLGARQKTHRGPYYHTYSGDSQPLDIRVRSRHVEYSPDVVWERRPHGRLWVFELAFNEDWRAIVGEIALANLYGPCRGIVIFTAGWADHFFENCIQILPTRREFGIYGKNMSEEQLTRLYLAKPAIEQRLRQWGFVWDH